MENFIKKFWGFVFPVILALLVVLFFFTIPEWSWDKGTEKQCRIWNGYLPVYFKVDSKELRDVVLVAVKENNKDLGSEIFKESTKVDEVILIRESQKEEYGKQQLCDEGTGAEYHISRRNDSHKAVSAQIVVCRKLENIDWVLVIRHELFHSLIGLKHVDDYRCNLMCKSKPKSSKLSDFELHLMKKIVKNCVKNKRFHNR